MNHIVCDGWAGFSFISNMEGYIREMYNPRGRDFGLWLSSTSDFESIWSQLKSILKNTYYIIPHQNFNLYLRDAEWLLNNKNKSFEKKIASFVEVWGLIYNMEIDNFGNYLYLIN